MAHRVTLRPSGHSYEVEEGKTVLQAGLDAGYMLPYSCRAGVCRTCRGTIVEGKVDYGAVHATYLPESDKAKGLALLCQAKPLGDLTVEVREVHGVRPRIIPCRVERMEKPAPDVAVLGLRLPMNENFRFLAGQYIDILLKEGRRRSYSLATKPEPGGVTALEIHVRHTPGGAFTTIYNFQCGPTDGQSPSGDLAYVNSRFYGTTELGGTSGMGAVFEIDPIAQTETGLYSFTGGKDGGTPESGVQQLAGAMFGTTSVGGSGSSGTIFRIP